MEPFSAAHIVLNCILIVYDACFPLLSRLSRYTHFRWMPVLSHILLVHQYICIMFTNPLWKICKCTGFRTIFVCPIVWNDGWMSIFLGSLKTWTLQEQENLNGRQSPPSPPLCLNSRYFRSRLIQIFSTLLYVYWFARTHKQGFFLTHILIYIATIH